MEKESILYVLFIQKDILPIIDEMIEDKNYKLLQLVSRARTKYINLKYTILIKG